MARLAAKARCNYYPLPDREAELIRSCLTFPDQPFSALDPCAGEGRAMAVITESSQAVRYGIELDSYRAEAATKVLDHVIQGDALSAHARVESFGLTYCNPPFDAEFGESGNQRFEVLFLSHFARWLVPGGVLIYVVPAQQLAGCAHVLASHFRDVQVFRLESPECVLYEQIVVFAIARSRRERDRTRDSEISFSRNRLVSTARQYERLPVLSERRVELRVPPTGSRRGVLRRLALRYHRGPAAHVSGVPAGSADTRSSAHFAQYKTFNSSSQGPHWPTFHGRALQRKIWFWRPSPRRCLEDQEAGHQNRGQRRRKDHHP